MSRGIDLKCLPECELWWNSPSSYFGIHSTRQITNLMNKSNVNKILSNLYISWLHIKTAEEIIVLWVQNTYFHEDLKCIKEQNALSKKITPPLSVYCRKWGGMIFTKVSVCRFSAKRVLRPTLKVTKSKMSLALQKT